MKLTNHALEHWETIKENPFPSKNALLSVIQRWAREKIHPVVAELYSEQEVLQEISRIIVQFVDLSRDKIFAAQLIAIDDAGDQLLAQYTLQELLSKSNAHQIHQQSPWKNRLEDLF